LPRGKLLIKPNDTLDITLTGDSLVGWSVDRATIRTVGAGLQRPECILAERDGTSKTHMYMYPAAQGRSESADRARGAAAQAV